MIVHRVEQARLQKISVIPSAWFRVRHGVNRGDGLGLADELCPDDVYCLAGDARLEEMAIDMAGGTGRVVRCETPSLNRAQVHLDATLLFISTEGLTHEVLSLVLTDQRGQIIDMVMAPLSPLEPSKDYVLVHVDRHAAVERLAQCSLVSFTSETTIMRADGTTAQVGDLRVGDCLLTRDSGSAEIRLLARQTVQARGLRAPVLIRKGAFGNSEDLLVSPEHRLLLGPGRQGGGAAQRGMMTQARNLVNGTTVERVDGGFVDYVQIVLDDHDFVFCAGAVLETTYIDHLTRHAFGHVDSLVLEALMSRHLASLQQRVETVEPDSMASGQWPELRAVAKS